MGFRSWLGLKAAPAPQFTPAKQTLGPFVEIDWTSIYGQTPADLWRTQPHLRTVVDFLARNVAQLGIHTFDRVSDTDRVRLTGDPVSLLLARPNSNTTRYELIRNLVGDLALFDNAYWWVAVSRDSQSGYAIRGIPAPWVVSQYGGDLFAPDGYVVIPPNGVEQSIPATQMIHFHGWSPSKTTAGTSAVETLKMVLAEQIHAVAYRNQRWINGGRTGAVLSRPAGAPEWSDPARQRFKADWKARFSGDGAPDAGGTPILEDGMVLQQVGFSAHEDEFVEAAKLSLTTVGSVYHVNPTMIGVLDNANYSNVREFRRMLYGDTLGPWLAMLEDRLNTFLLPMIGVGGGVYVEFNIAEKLQGSFEETASIMSTLVGRPVLTANEGRALLNRPAMGGDADQLVTPLNVIVGGQPSPQTPIPGSPKAIPGPGRPGGSKAAATGREVARTEKVLQKFFRRQRAAVMSSLGAKADPEWWDSDRWDEELGDDLFRLAVAVSETVSAKTLADLGFDPDVYDTGRTLAFLRAVADSRARMINQTTLSQLLDAMAADADPAAVFDKAENSRAAQSAVTLTTTFAGFGTTEAVKQVSARGTKTWVVTSARPRPEHAAMNGETVPIDEKFSNSAEWPGDPVLGADGVAGCTCTVTVDA